MFGRILHTKFNLAILFFTEKDEPMVQCCNIKCPRGWFHLSCVEPPLTEMPDEKDWFCSKQCEKSKGYIYCICQEKKGKADAEMLECFSGEDCKKHQFYHLDCLFQEPKECEFFCTIVVYISGSKY